MNWLVQTEKNSKGFLIELPDRLPADRPFQVKVDNEIYMVAWNAAQQTLFVGDQNSSGYSQTYQVRHNNVTVFPDDPMRDVEVEYRSPEGISASIRAKTAIHIPGIKQAVQTAQSNGALIRSPMAGKVLKVLVQDGQAVSKGDVVCVIEAMKMENQISAAASGIVAELKIKEGDQTTPQSKLMIIKEK